MRFFELNHVALHVADVPASCQFYETILQLDALPRPNFDFPGAWFQLGEVQELHLIGRREEAVTVAGSRSNHYALLVDDMDEWESHLQSHDVEYEPRRFRPDGAQQIFLRDPDGHAIELCTRPASN